MDDDGFSVHSGKKRGATRGPSHRGALESFRTDISRYAGSEEDFDKAHARRYGREEDLDSDGKHKPGRRHFPPGSERQILYTRYDNSTDACNRTGQRYQDGVEAADQVLDRMTQEERRYYLENTGGYAPHQHEGLDLRAGQFRDSSLRNADHRKAMLKSHPHGYHSALEQQEHYDYAERAYGNYEYADERQRHHAKHRSYANVDTRRDKWGRPVSHR